MKYSVEVKNLSVKFDNFYAVSNISFQVYPGEIFGFLGANGAGKTTTIRVLCGLIPPTEGEVSVAGISSKSPMNEIKKHVGYMSQRFTLYNDLTITENLNFAGALRKLPATTIKKRSEELFEFINFKRDPNELVAALPGGIKQQVSLVASMLHDPEVIFLDEPTAGVSPTARVLFWNLIKKLRQRGKTIFVTTHYMDEAEECERIALMRAGEIIALDSPAQLKHHHFKGTLVEISQNKTQNDWIEIIRNDSQIENLTPYGINYHAILKDEQSLTMLQQQYQDRANFKIITPSLEDVFIHLVEGKNR